MNDIVKLHLNQLIFDILQGLHSRYFFNLIKCKKHLYGTNKFQKVLLMKISSIQNIFYLFIRQISCLIPIERHSKNRLKSIKNGENFKNKAFLGRTTFISLVPDKKKCKIQYSFLLYTYYILIDGSYEKKHFLK